MKFTLILCGFVSEYTTASPTHAIVTSASVFVKLAVCIYVTGWGVLARLPLLCDWPAVA